MKTALALVALAACGATVAPIAHPTASACDGGDDAAARAHWAARDAEAEAHAAIDAWWRAASACPADPDRYLAIARADDYLAETFLVGTDEYRSRVADGRDAALAGLAALSPAFARARTGGAKVDAAAEAAGLDARAAPLLYWWGTDAMAAARATGLWATVGAFGDVRDAMQRVRTLAPATAHFGADRYLGAFYASAPSIAGGDLDTARAHLDAALAGAPGFLENPLVVAIVDAKAHDPARYRALLQSIVDARVADDDDDAPEQRAAQARARELLR